MNDDSKYYVLMTPGPVMVSDAVLEELAKPLIFHRYEEFQALYGQLVARLHRLFGGTPNHKCLMFTGSGTLANETVLCSVFHEKDKVLVVSNGDFGERLATICGLHNIPTIHHKLDYFEAADPEEVVNIASLRGATGIAMVEMETSTGMINPVRDIGLLLKKRNDGRMTFFVDAVSAFGCESVDVGDCAISYCTSVPNKALEGPPGISFACVDINLYMSREHVPRNYYLDLSRYIAFDARLQTPTTPSIPQFRALQKALDLIEEEGIVNRRARYLSLSGRLIERLEPLGFRPVIKNQAHRSPAVTAFEVPEDVNADELNMFLRKKGFILWFPKHYHRQGTVRLVLASVMGCIYECHIDSLADAVRSFIS